MPIQIVRNDITKMKVDAIVNAANESLLGGGGVDGAIHRAAGPELLAECRTLHGCETGDAKITKGYRLPAKFVIHTVGPVWQGGSCGEKGLLTSCYRKSLELAVRYGCQSVAFPLISAGVYGYPKDQALKVALDAVSEFLLNESQDLLVYIVVFNREATRISQSLFTGIRQFVDDHYVASHEDYCIERRRQAQVLHAPMALEIPECAPCAPKELSLEDLLKQADAGFTETLLKRIDQSGKKDSEIYKKANLSKQLFSKIRNNPNYKPTKATALALAIALELDLEDTQDLIGRAGYALTNSSKQDLIVKYFILRGNYNIVEINLALYEFDQALLGSA